MITKGHESVQDFSRSLALQIRHRRMRWDSVCEDKAHSHFQATKRTRGSVIMQLENLSIGQVIVTSKIQVSINATRNASK